MPRIELPFLRGLAVVAGVALAACDGDASSSADGGPAASDEDAAVQDASSGDGDAGGPGDTDDAALDGGTFEPRCDVEPLRRTAASDPAPVCRVEASSLDRLSSISFSVEQGERSLFVFLEHPELAPGATFELPYASDEGHTAQVRYSPSADEPSQRATEGEIEVVAVGRAHVEVELRGVRFESIPELEVEGVIGGEPAQHICVVCAP